MISLAPGETLQLHVSATSDTRYEVLIYRLGWYQGNGARLVGCVPACGSDRAGQRYPVPAPDPSTGFLDAGFEPLSREKAVTVTTELTHTSTTTATVTMSCTGSADTWLLSAAGTRIVAIRVGALQATTTTA